jgi:hypothetical protein
MSKTGKIIAASEAWEAGDPQPMFALIKELREPPQTELRPQSTFSTVYSPEGTPLLEELRAGASPEKPVIQWNREQIEEIPAVMSLKKAMGHFFRAMALMSEQPTLADTVPLPPLNSMPPSGKPN